MLNPPRIDIGPSEYNVTAQYGIPVYGGIQYVAQQDPELLPPGYAEVFANLSNILNPLLNDCTPDSGAPEAFGAPLADQNAGDSQLAIARQHAHMIKKLISGLVHTCCPGITAPLMLDAGA